MRKTTVFVAALVLVAVAGGVALSHCEIPCGIYDDKARIGTIRESIATVERSMRRIAELSAREKPDWNQLVRWIDNKEEHAGQIQDVVTRYFMTQRVKVPPEGDAKAGETYVRQLTSLHRLLVVAMRMKQTTDLARVEEARKLVDEFATAYFGPEDLKDLVEEHD